MAIVLDGTSGITNDSGYTGDGVSFADSTPANTLVTTSGGNVGIGTDSPSGLLTLNAASASAQLYIKSGDSNDAAIIFGGQTDGATASIAFYHSDNSLRFSGYNNSARMRIDSSGNLLVGKTSLSNDVTTAGGFIAASGKTVLTTTGTDQPLVLARNNNTGSMLEFYYGGSIRGSVSTNGSTIAYNTSSDYRLKENIAPMTGALAKVAALKPVTYTWKSTGEADEGFIAHELQAVCPSAVTGEKDAVDADGNPVYQGIDTSFLVATLTAAIQELKAEVDSLKAQINGANA